MKSLSRISKKFPGRFVPKMHQTKTDENIKFLNIKNGTSRTEFLTQKDIHELHDKFRFRLSIAKPVKLGNTGILLSYRDGKFVLTKNK